MTKLRSSLSNYQYGTLKYFATHDVHIEHLQTMNMTTVMSLIKHGYIVRTGTHIEVTPEGAVHLDSYAKARPNLRVNENLEISKRVQELLNLRNLHVMKAGRREAA